MQKIKGLGKKYGDYEVDYIEYIRDAERKLIGCWVAINVENTETTHYVGKSICNPKDVFNKKIGRAIAIGRALKLAAGDKPEPTNPHLSILYYKSIKQIPAWANACGIAEEALPDYIKGKKVART